MITLEIELALKKAKETNELVIDAQTISDEVWDKVCYLTTLKNIFLFDCIVDKVDSRISEFKGLEILELKTNALKKFPIEILEIKNLKELTLKLDKSVSIPKEIYRLENLENLYILESYFKEFPKQILELKNLKSLSIFNENNFKFRYILTDYKTNNLKDDLKNFYLTIKDVKIKDFTHSLILNYIMYPKVKTNNLRN